MEHCLGGVFQEVICSAFLYICAVTYPGLQKPHVLQSAQGGLDGGAADTQLFAQLIFRRNLIACLEPA